MILTSRIPVKALIDAANPDLNVALQGGEEIRVPPAGKVFVVGNVKKPGSFPIRDSSESTILKALALSEGLMPYASETAYIYRMEDSKSEKTEIAVDLRKIMKRQSADVALRANDILYIPDRTGKRAAITSLERMLSIGTGLGTAAILVAR
jgi:polysaccharide export outer membrane protein